MMATGTRIASEDRHMTRITVIGGSSGVGLACVKEALGRGHTVRMFSRSASATDLRHEQLETLVGDALDTEDVAKALTDTEVVLQTLGVPLGPKLVTGPITLFSRSTAVLLPAMQAAAVRRLVALTGFGAGDSSSSIALLQRPGFRLLLGKAYDDKSTQERMIKASGLEWTIARPGVLRNGAKTGEYRILTNPKTWRNGIIRRADVADFMVTAATGADHLGQAPVLIEHGLLPFT